MSPQRIFWIGWDPLLDKIHKELFFSNVLVRHIDRWALSRVHGDLAIRSVTYSKSSPKRSNVALNRFCKYLNSYSSEIFISLFSCPEAVVLYLPNRWLFLVTVVYLEPFRPNQTMENPAKQTKSKKLPFYRWASLSVSHSSQFPQRYTQR